MQALINSLEDPKHCPTTETKIEDIVSEFTELITDAAKSCQPLYRKKCKHKKKYKSKKWFDKSCWNLKKVILQCAKQVASHPDCPILRGKLFTLKKQYKKLVKFKKKKFKNEILEKIQTLETTNPKDYWKLVETLRTMSTNKNQNQTPIDPDEWFAYFRKLSNPQTGVNNPFDEGVEFFTSHFDKFSSPIVECLDKPFDSTEIYVVSRKLKNNKASGIDSVSNEMIKCCLKFHCKFFVNFFNKLLKSGCFPHCWSDGFITPLHKSGDISDPNNYRGITINSSLGKFFTLLLNSRLTTFLESNKVIKPNQIGFRKNHRTADHIFVLKTILDSLYQSKKKLYVCFVDFKKAYDSIWRKGLFYKLIKCGLSKTFITILNNMYDKVRSCVKTSEGLTNFFESKAGVKQGCNLSPNLFNIFVNDLPDIFDSTCDPVPLGESLENCLLYADDLLLMSLTENGLQHCLNKLYDYTKIWKLNVNLKKTKVMVFNKSGRKLKLNCMFGKTKVEMATSYTYLGCVLTPSGSFSANQDHLYKKGLRALFSLLKDFNPQKGAPVRLFLKLFDSLVKPVLLYNCEIWGAYVSRKLSFQKFNEDLFQINLVCEKLQLKMYKFILGVNMKATNWAVRSELGRFPIHVEVFSTVISYLYHMLNVHTESELLINALKSSFHINHNGGTSWFSLVGHLMKFLDLGYTKSLESLAVGPRSSTKSFRKRLEKAFIEKWNAERQDIIKGQKKSSKLELYVNLKSHYGREKYLDNLVDAKSRKFVTQIRISAHKFPVEQGRYVNTPREQRLCNICDCKVVGDEYHYLFMCRESTFKQHREKFIKEILNVNMNFRSFDYKSLFYYILSLNDHSIFNLTVKFIGDIMESFISKI